MKLRTILYFLILISYTNLVYSQKATDRLYEFYNSTALDDLSPQDAFDTYRYFIKDVFEDDEITKCKAKDCLFLDILYLWIDLASYQDIEQSPALAEDIRFFQSKGLDLNKKLKGYKRYLFSETFDLLVKTLYDTEEVMYIPNHLSTIIKALIEVGVDFNSPTRNGNGWESIIESIISDNPEEPYFKNPDLLIEIMMDNGIDMNKARNGRVDSPFIYTLIIKNKKVLESMIKNGVDVNQTSGEIDPMSMVMLYNEVTDFQIIKMLLQAGFDPNYADTDNGITPLMNLAYTNNTTQPILDSVLSLLEEKGANFNAQDKNGDTVLHHALRRLDYMLIVLNKNRTNAHLKNKNGYTVLEEAEFFLKTSEYKKDPRLIAIVDLLRKASLR